MNSKENDLFLNRLFNPDMTISDFEEVGLTANNTSLESEEAYSRNEQIKNNPLFQTNGTYDPVKLHNFYETTLGGYNQLAKDTYYGTLVKTPIFYKDDLFAPAELRNPKPETTLIRMQNPFGNMYGTQGLNSFAESPFSYREKAQQNDVLLNPEEVDFEKGDFSKAKWGKSLNEMSLFTSPSDFFGNFMNTQVMSKWEEDGEHINPVTGALEKHKKGDLRKDSTGNFFYENLNGRDVYGKEVMSKWDNLTVDGTLVNSFDVFDSDDKNKSLQGTLIREAIEIIPMFCPYVGPVYLGSRIFLQLTDVLALLGKMGSDYAGEDTPLLSGIQGLNESLSISRSDNALNDPWALENLITMAGDVVRQLSEQRFLFKQSAKLFGNPELLTEEGLAARKGEIAQNYMKEHLGLTAEQDLTEAIFKRTISNNITPATMQELSMMAQSTASTITKSELANMHKWGELMARAYMTGLTVADAYGEAKLGGAEDWQAALLTLGYAAGEWALLSTDIGKWILPELRQERGLMRASVSKLTQAEALDGTTKREKLSIARRLLEYGKKIAHAEYTVGGTGAEFGRNVLANALGEGFEETTEELLYDAVKSIGNLSYWLSGSDKRFEAFDNWGLRYVQSFLGGVFGGAIAQVNPDYLKSLKSYSDMTFDQALQNVVWLLGENKKEDLINIIQRMPVDSRFLAASNPEYDENGFVTRKPGTKNDNMDTASKQIIIDVINQIDDILNSNAASISTSSLLYGHFDVVKDARLSRLLQSVAGEDGSFNQSKVGSIGNYLQQFNTARTDYVKAMLELDILLHPKEKVLTSNRDQYIKEHQEDISKAQQKVKESKEKLDEFLTHKNAAPFIRTLLKELTPDYMGAYMAVNEILYASLKASHDANEIVPYDKLTKERREALHGDWVRFKQSAEYKDRLREAEMLSTEITKLWSPILQATSDNYYKQITEGTMTKLDEWLQQRAKVFSYVANQRQGDWTSAFKQAFQELFNIGEYKENISLMNSPEVTLLLTLGGEEAVNFIDEQLELIESLPSTEEVENDVKRQKLIDDVKKRVNDKINSGNENDVTAEEGSVTQTLTDISEFNGKSDVEIISELEKQLENTTDDKEKEALTNTINKLKTDKDYIAAYKTERQQTLDNLLKSNLINYVNGTQNQVRTSIKDKLFEQLQEVEKVFEPIIAQGYIHPELRSKSVQLLYQLQNYVGTVLMEEPDPVFQELIEKIQALPGSPILKILDQLQLSVSNPSITFSQLYNMIEQMLDGRSLDDIELGADTQEAIDSALLLLRLIDAELLGASTDSIGQGSVTGNLFGLFATINEIERKFGVEEKTNAPEIQTSIAERIKQDYYPIKAKLELFKTLSSINNAQKLEEQNRVAARFYAIMTNRIKSRILGNKDKWKDWDVVPEGQTVGVFTALQNAVNEATTINALAGSPNTRVNNETSKKIEQERTKIENAIYDLFQNNKDKDLKSVFDYTAIDYFDSEEYLLTAEAKETHVSDLHFLYWLMSKALVKTSSFLKTYQEAIVRNPEIAPITGQEIGVNLVYSIIVSGDDSKVWFDAIQRAATEANASGEAEAKFKGDRNKCPVKELPADAVNVLRYFNTVLIEGAPGTGKTTGVMQTTKAMLDCTPDGAKMLEGAWFVHISEERAESFANDVGITQNYQAFDRSSLLKKISDYELEKQTFVSQNIIEYKLIKDEVSGIYRTTHKLKPLGTNEQPPKFIFIDEVGKFTTIEMDLIDRFAQEHGITVIALGDLDQSKTKAVPPIDPKSEKKERRVDGLEYQGALFRGNFPHSIKLGVTLRPDNEFKKKNQEYLQARKLELRNDLAFPPHESKLYRFYYYQDETGIYGDKQYTLSSKVDPKIIEDIKLMVSTLTTNPKTNQPYKIGYAYYKESSPLYVYLTTTDEGKELLKHIELKKDGSSQGDESQYYIIEENEKAYKDKDYDSFVEDLYTGVTRSRQGSLLLISRDINSTLQENNVYIASQQQTSKQNLELTNQQKQNSITSRVETIKSIVSDTEVYPTIKLRKNASVLSSKITTKQEDNDQQYAFSPNEDGEVQYDRALVGAQEILGQRAAKSNQIKAENKLNKKSGPDEDEVDIFMYSFNCFETGWSTTDGELTKPTNSDDRIDGLNGLNKLYTEQNGIELSGDHIGEAINVIDLVRKAVFYNQNKADAIEEIKNLTIGGNSIFGDNIQISFAYQKVYSDAPSSLGQDPTVEQVLNIHNFNDEGKEIEEDERTYLKKCPQTQKLVVLVKKIDPISKNEQVVFTTPILTLPSFVTLLNSKQFSQFKAGWDYTGTKDWKTNIADLKTYLLTKLNTPGAKTLLYLTSLWSDKQTTLIQLDTKNGLGEDWVPGKTLIPTGAILDVKAKGYREGAITQNSYLVEGYDTQKLDEGKDKDKSWFVPISTFSNDYGLVISRPSTSITGALQVGDHAIHYAKKGSPFILYTDDTNIDPDQMENLYIKQIYDYVDYLEKNHRIASKEGLDLTQIAIQDIPIQFKRIKLAYVVPPIASIRDYLKQEIAVLTKAEVGEDDIAKDAIGMCFDTFRLLSAPGVMSELFKPGEGADGFTKATYQMAKDVLRDIQKCYDVIEGIRSRASKKGRNTISEEDLNAIHEQYQKMIEILKDDKYYYKNNDKSQGLKIKDYAPPKYKWPMRAFMRKFLIDSLAFTDPRVLDSKPEIKDDSLLSDFEKYLTQAGITGIPYNVKTKKVEGTNSDILQVVLPIDGEFTINGKFDGTVMHGNIFRMLKFLYGEVITGKNHNSIAGTFQQATKIAEEQEPEYSKYINSLQGISDEVKTQLISDLGDVLRVRYGGNIPVDATITDEDIKNWAKDPKERRQYLRIGSYTYIGKRGSYLMDPDLAVINVTESIGKIEFTIDLNNVPLADGTSVTCTYQGSIDPRDLIESITLTPRTLAKETSIALPDVSETEKVEELLRNRASDINNIVQEQLQIEPRTRFVNLLMRRLKIKDITQVQEILAGTDTASKDKLYQAALITILNYKEDYGELLTQQTETKTINCKDLII